MQKMKNAIVRKPGSSMVNGISSAGLGKPDFAKACIQHEKYIAALKSCSLSVTVLDAVENFPDSVFIEDVAVMADNFAVITCPGAQSRQGEENEIKQAVARFRSVVEEIVFPGTLEGGDVMKVENSFFVGLSARTNPEGFRQFSKIVKSFGYKAVAVDMREFLHLKTGVAYLESGIMLVAGEFVSHRLFSGFDRIAVPPKEAYAANSVWINGNVLVPAGFPRTAEAIQKRGLPVLVTDVAEFRKLDGGLSCLSLRF